MINPPPRPALRKAPDADLHPVAVTPAPPVSLRPVVGIGGRTSDTLLGAGKKAKRTDLSVKVPKALVKAARKTATARDESLDDVVEQALRHYVERG